MTTPTATNTHTQKSVKDAENSSKFTPFDLTAMLEHQYATRFTPTPHHLILKDVLVGLASNTNIKR